MRPLRALTLLVALSSIAPPLRAQTDATCMPASERADRKVGCFVLAQYDMGRLLIRPPLYWHLDVYTDRRAADRAHQRDNRSTVVETMGKIWLFTIAPFDWKTPDGEHWGSVGPLPVTADVSDYRAVYVEGALEPFLNTAPHRHDGAEAWFTLEGSICAETPEGKQEQSVGEPGGVVVPGGVPMVLSGTGVGPHRALGVILQSATKPMSTPASDWTPKNSCRG